MPRHTLHPSPCLTSCRGVISPKTCVYWGQARLLARRTSYSLTILSVTIRDQIRFIIFTSTSPASCQPPYLQRLHPHYTLLLWQSDLTEMDGAGLADSDPDPPPRTKQSTDPPRIRRASPHPNHEALWRFPFPPPNHFIQKKTIFVSLEKLEIPLSQENTTPTKWGNFSIVGAWRALVNMNAPPAHASPHMHT